MEQRVSLITLGVSDIAAARDFYAALGWEGHEVEETIFFQAGGLGVVLWGREKLASDGHLEDESEDGFGGIALAHNVRSREEVDSIIAAAKAAGATISKKAEETFYGGYAAYFTDLDGHVWEVAHNPGFAIAADGSLQLPF